jgi:hypothetical protein
MKTIVILLLALAGLRPLHAQQVIDFETLPNGSLPTDGMAISNQFLATFGVSFAFTNGNFPHIAKAGVPLSAFYSPYGDDTLSPGQNCGNFFLTDNGTVGTPPPPLIISYSTPVSAATGVILDIDGPEAWDIQARNGLAILATIHLSTNSPNGSNACAAPWSFQRASNDITSIWIIYTGTRLNRVGLAFDNFSPANSIVPPALSSLGMSNGVMSFNVAANFGQNCRVEYATSFPPTNWLVLTNVFLTNTPSQQIVDFSATNSPRRFYRAVGLP